MRKKGFWKIFNGYMTTDKNRQKNLLNLEQNFSKVFTENPLPHKN